MQQSAVIEVRAYPKAMIQKGYPEVYEVVTAYNNREDAQREFEKRKKKYPMRMIHIDHEHTPTRVRPLGRYAHRKKISK